MSPIAEILFTLAVSTVICVLSYRSGYHDGLMKGYSIASTIANNKDRKPCEVIPIQ